VKVLLNGKTRRTSQSMGSEKENAKLAERRDLFPRGLCVIGNSHVEKGSTSAWETTEECDGYLINHSTNFSRECGGEKGQ